MSLYSPLDKIFILHMWLLYFDTSVYIENITLGYIPI